MKADLGLKAKDTKAVAEALAKVLANTHALSLKTQNFHWNVVGPGFVYLHDLFGKHYEALNEALDELAERIRALGHVAPGSYKEFAALAEIEEAGAPPAAREMIASLLAGNEAMIRLARKAKDLAEKVGDSETGDMLIERMQGHAKAAWMLRAQLE
jgi:starvation-inducible DNA-binding protein